MKEVFHSGELEIQKRTGEEKIAELNKNLVSPYIVKGAINFVEKQPMVIVGSRNRENELWASILIGDFGFIEVPKPSTVVFNTEKIVSTTSDIFYRNILEDNQIGSLFIELSTRKRLRANGSCAINGPKIEMSIEQAYPNCPKYIQRRAIAEPEHFKKTQTEDVIEGIPFDDEVLDFIKSADTFFVASAATDGKLDASHRGGNPGFLGIIKNNTIKIPDYPGNSLFNTWGNITQNPNVGLLFIDFEKRETLQLTGHASLLFDQHSEDDLLKTKGTGRFWLFESLRSINHHQVEWNFLEYSPFNP